MDGPAHPPGRRILVVDDEEDTLALTEAILRARGYRVQTAGSGARAIALLDDPPDAVLLDVMMPVMSGLDVLAHMRATPRLGRVPVILLTARQSDRDVVEGYQQGADYYITKPCTAQQIEYGLRMILPERGRSSETAPGTVDTNPGKGKVAPCERSDTKTSGLG
jgi:DNA-binding response OmpR family regulator